MLIIICDKCGSCISDEGLCEHYTLNKIIKEISMPKKLESCVKKVKRKGKSKSSSQNLHLMLYVLNQQAIRKRKVEVGLKENNMFKIEQKKNKFKVTATTIKGEEISQDFKIKEEPNPTDYFELIKLQQFLSDFRDKLV